MQFNISASHTYTEEGSYSISINTVDDGGSTLQTPAAAQIGDVPVLSSSSFPPVIPLGLPLVAPVATFTDTNPFGVASDFTATINWGDNSPTSQGTILSFGNAQFGVLGQHTYGGSGLFHPIVTITDDGGSFTLAPGQIDVTASVPEPASLSLLGAGSLVALLAGRRRLTTGARKTQRT